jgi:hypothetical protein
MLRRLSGLGMLAVAVSAAVAVAWAPSPGASPQPQGAAPEGKEARKPDGPPKAPAPLSSAQILKQLAGPIDIPDVLAAPTNLAEAFQYLQKVRGWPPVAFDRSAFLAENPDAADVRDTQVQLPPLKAVPRARVLRMLLDAIPTGNATYLVRGGHVLITTRQGAGPGRQVIHAASVKKPLEEALQDLAEETGVSVLLDARAATQGRTAVTANFRNETTLLNAVRLLADMAGLKVVVADNAVYVTLSSNRARFPETELFRKNLPAEAGAQVAPARAPIW